MDVQLSREFEDGDKIWPSRELWSVVDSVTWDLWEWAPTASWWLRTPSNFLIVLLTQSKRDVTIVLKLKLTSLRSSPLDMLLIWQIMCDTNTTPSTSKKPFPDKWNTCSMLLWYLSFRRYNIVTRWCQTCSTGGLNVTAWHAERGNVFYQASPMATVSRQSNHCTLIGSNLMHCRIDFRAVQWWWIALLLLDSPHHIQYAVGQRSSLVLKCVRFYSALMWFWPPRRRVVSLRNICTMLYSCRWDFVEHWCICVGGMPQSCHVYSLSPSLPLSLSKTPTHMRVWPSTWNQVCTYKVLPISDLVPIGSRSLFMLPCQMPDGVNILEHFG